MDSEASRISRGFQREVGGECSFIARFLAIRYNKAIK